MPLTKRGKLKETERAYLAGYFDAEGNVNVGPQSKGTTWIASITFGQTNPAVVQQLHARYGSTLRPASSKNPRERLAHIFTTGRLATVRCILLDVLPYIGEKRDQVEAVLQRFALGMSQEVGAKLQHGLQVMKQRRLPKDVFITKVQDRQRRCADLNCNRRARSRGYCTKHYQSARAQGRISRILGPDRKRPFEYRRQPTATDLAYFAGYFDGDGTFEVALRSRRWYVFVSFNQTQAYAVEHMAEVYGGSLRIRPPRTKSRRPQLRYYLAQQNAVNQFLHDIRPYLIEKAEEVDLLFREFSPSMSVEQGTALKQALTARRNHVHLSRKAAGSND